MFFWSQICILICHQTKISYSFHTYEGRGRKTIAIELFWYSASISTPNATVLNHCVCSCWLWPLLWEVMCHHPIRWLLPPSSLLRRPCYNGPRLMTWEIPRLHGNFHLSNFRISGVETVKLCSLDNADRHYSNWPTLYSGHLAHLHTLPGGQIVTRTHFRNNWP